MEDGSWHVKKANCLQVQTERGKKELFICDNSDEHKQWLDALFYATTVSKLAEYCSPLSGGWLHFLEVFLSTRTQILRLGRRAHTAV